MAKKHLVTAHQKRSQSQKYDDPSAFYKRWPRIERLADEPDEDMMGQTVAIYRMGRVRALVKTPEVTGHGYFMAVKGWDRYPWDELVWLRYNLLPDSCRMACILPNLNAYINEEDSDQAHGGRKYVFTLEQVGWILDPMPSCPNCFLADILQEMNVQSVEGRMGKAVCPLCKHEMTIDLSNWNELHGNGFLVGR